jgi:phage tail-like protein
MAERTNPYGAFNFMLEFQGPPGIAVDSSKVGFMECTGLDSETMPMEYRDSAVPARVNEIYASYTRKIPGMERYPNVVLRRGLTDHTALWDWRKRVRDDEPWDQITATVIITLQDEKRIGLISWELENAWPCKLSGPVLNARTNEIAIETLELCCDRISFNTSDTPPPS